MMTAGKKIPVQGMENIFPHSSARVMPGRTSVTTRRLLQGASPPAMTMQEGGSLELQVLSRLSSAEWEWIEHLRDRRPFFTQREFHPRSLQRGEELRRAFGSAAPHSGDFLLHYAGDPLAGNEEQPWPLLLVHGANSNADFWIDPLHDGSNRGLAPFMKSRGFKVFAVTFSHNQDDNFIPINLRLGSRLTTYLDDYNSVSFAVDFNKLLVPTEPVWSDSLDDDGNRQVIRGFDPDVAVPVGMVQSFYDSPGGFKEELHEIMISAGAEYWYRDQFAIRTGYFHEHATKGNRKYFTMGIGLKLNVFALDFAYLVPTSGRSNPLANTMRFTLLFEFESYKATSRD